MSAWSVETRRALARHFRDARAYAQKNAAVHEISSPPGTYMPPLASERAPESALGSVRISDERHGHSVPAYDRIVVEKRHTSTK